MRTELKVLRPADRDTWYSGLMLAFGGVLGTPEEREIWDDLTEDDRCIGAWDGDLCVGTTGAFSFRMTVPGGAPVPAAGVTMVSVAATHRRRGILTSMMRRQLDDVRASGEPLAVLTASEPAIYGRFGYGVATRQLSAEIDTSRVTLTVPAGTDDVRLRFAAQQEVAEQCEALYAATVGSRPGMIVRAPAGSGKRFSIHRPSARADRPCSASSPSGTVPSSATPVSTSSRRGTRRAPKAPSW